MTHFLITSNFKKNSPIISSKIEQFISSQGFSFTDTCEELSPERNFIFCSSVRDLPEAFSSKEDFIVVLKDLNQDLFQSDSMGDFYELGSEQDLEAVLYLIEIYLKERAAEGQKYIDKNLLRVKKELQANYELINGEMSSILSQIESIEDFERLVSKLVLSPRSFPPSSKLILDTKRGDYQMPGEKNDQIYPVSLSLIQRLIKNIGSTDTDLNYLKDQLNRDYLVLFDAKNDPIWFSPKVSELGLNPREILGSKSAITVNDTDFTMNRYNLEQGDYLVVLNKSELGSSTSHNEELGIISSSIAHELNNPMGGILAALDVLLLDDREASLEESLKNMKKTVLRCKKLVETFLGFARRDIIQNNQLAYEDIVEQAYELVKFRLLETNYKLKWNYSQLEQFRFSCNESVMTMIFYLFFNKILTEQSHQNLLAQKQQNTLEVDIVENRDFITLNFESSLKLNFKRESLFSNLFELSQLRFQSKAGSLAIDGL